MHGLAQSSGGRFPSDFTAQGFLAWELILAGTPSDRIAEALGLDKETSARLCAAVIAAADISGFVQASHPGFATTIRDNVFVPPIPPFTGLLSFWARDLTCRYANQNHEQWFGKPPAAVVGHAMIDLLGPIWFGLCEPHIRMAVMSAKKQTFDVITATADGGMVEYLNYYAPTSGASGKIIGFFCYIVDVSQLRE
jgi:PAS domain-containing protein